MCFFCFQVLCYFLEILMRERNALLSSPNCHVSSSNRVELIKNFTRVHTNFVIWSSSSLTSALYTRLMWHFPNSRHAFLLISVLLTFSITINATVLYSIVDSNLSSSCSKRFLSMSDKD